MKARANSVASTEVLWPTPHAGHQKRVGLPVLQRLATDSRAELDYVETAHYRISRRVPSLRVLQLSVVQLENLASPDNLPAKQSREPNEDREQVANRE
jgi:hypothetical protein